MNVALKRGWGQPFGEHKYFSRSIFNPKILSAGLQVQESKTHKGKFHWAVCTLHNSAVFTGWDAEVLYENPRDAMDEADKYYRSEAKRINEALKNG